MRSARNWRKRLVQSRYWLFLSVLGPGIIAANADNDATGILGYTLAGAKFQYSMLWALALCTLALAVCQEIGARMGVVTGKGLADLIREEYGVKITAVAMAALLIANFATTVAEFAGMLAAVQIFAGPNIRFILLPLMAIAVWMLVARGSYRGLERVLLAAAGVYILYIISACLSHPDWGQVVRQTFVPDLSHIQPVSTYVFVLISLIGTTITPWGQFYIQSSVRDKGINEKDYGYTRLDVFFGAFFTTGIAWFIIVCCGATLFRAGVHDIPDAGMAALALKPLAGTLATTLFAIGLFNASMFGAVAVPLSTAYALTEALGWESGVGRRPKEAPLFIGVFTFMVAIAALIVMLFPGHLTTLIILPNVVGAMLLPIILVITLRLANKKRLMGRYTNTRAMNVVAWVTTLVLIGLSVTLIGAILLGMA